MCASENDRREEGGKGPGPVRSPSSPGIVPEAELDPRVRSAWRTWLSALATDAEAAMAAALAYESLNDEGRDAWLETLEQDAPTLHVPKIALYAPLLAVEPLGARRARIEDALSGQDETEENAPSSRETRALRGVAPDGKHLCVILSPLYLDFVQVLVCRYTPQGGFTAVRHDPLRHLDDIAFENLREMDGVAVEETPLRVVVEELAHAILADRRARRDAPPALTHFAHLFGPHLDDGDRSD
jgi:hypothetical protein